MNGQQPLLLIEPDENLVFRFGERGIASSTFRIWNNAGSFVAFKVRTTNPRLRGPSYGLLSPGSYRNVEVTVLGQEGALPNMQHGDSVWIMGLVASSNDTEDSIRRMFREREAMAEYHELRVAYATQPWNLFRRAIFFAFSCLVFWFLTMAILSRIWTLIYGVTVLVLRMMRVKALDAAEERIEEWIGNTLLYLGLSFLSAAGEHVLGLIFRLLKVIYETFLALCDHLFSFLFEPEVRRPRRRN